MEPEVLVIGGGLAGSEAAWQAARAGLSVRLYEMRPGISTPAHKTGKLAELVCSNSLKSELPGSAPYLLKQELRRLDSLVLSVADQTRVPSGHALSVDREQFSAGVTERIARHPLIEVLREEVRELPLGRVAVVATGPLTSDALSQSIGLLAGLEHLYFYDAISPVVDASTLDRSKLFAASRYGKGGDDYLNAPMNRAQYLSFYESLISAESAPMHDFEKAMYFEACLPIEELARRGVDTLRFGPMKPVGLVDPGTGRRPYAAVQLRLENLMADSYNLVGFQNHLKFPEQKRVFRLIPGLEQAEFTRFGQMHRNTFIQSPRVLQPTLQARKDPQIFFAGQICGVEGYVESIATGLIAGLNAARLVRGEPLLTPPRDTALGSLVHYISCAEPSRFQPANISFGLLPPPPPHIMTGVRDRRKRHEMQVALALDSLARWMEGLSG